MSAEGRREALEPASDPSQAGDVSRFLPEVELVLGLISPARHAVITRYNDQRRQRARQFTDHLKEAGLDPEVLERLLQTDGATELLVAAFTAALDAHLAKKRAALATAVRNGLLASDSAAIDHARVLVRTMEQLEAVHIRVLLEIANGDDPRPAPVEGKPGSAHGGIGGATHETLAAVWPDDEGIVRALTSFLESQGLISREATWDALEGGGTWFVTPFGRALLSLLESDDATDGRT